MWRQWKTPFPDQINSTAVTMVLKELVLLVKDGPRNRTQRVSVRQ